MVDSLPSSRPGTAARIRPWLASLAASGYGIILTTPGARMRRPAVALWIGLRLAALGFVLYGVATTPPGLGLHGRLLLITVCTALAAAGWIGWLATAMIADHSYALIVSLSILVVSGSLAAGIDPASPSQALCGLGVFATVLALPPRLAIAVFGAGLATLWASSLASGHALGSIGTYAVVLAGIALGGFNRRQYVLRVRQAESLVEQTRRTQVEQARAAALSERARIAREIHDVLAHSLGALAVQLDAADALLTAGQDADRAHRHVARARRLAVDGMAETRRAIGALRGEALPLPEQLTGLSRDYQADTGTPASLEVSGTPRRLPPDVELTAFRTAQEALSNARKHAPDAPVLIELTYSADGVALAVTDQSPGGDAAPGDGEPKADLAGTGGGFGLTGLSERAALIGGVLTAGPESGGWAVRLWLPQ